MATLKRKQHFDDDPITATMMDDGGSSSDSGSDTDGSEYLPTQKMRRKSKGKRAAARSSSAVHSDPVIGPSSRLGGGSVVGKQRRQEAVEALPTARNPPKAHVMLAVQTPEALQTESLRPRKRTATIPVVPARDVRALQHEIVQLQQEVGHLRESKDAYGKQLKQDLVLAECLMRKKVSEIDLKRKQIQSMHWVTSRRLNSLELHHKNHILKLTTEVDAQKARVLREQTEKLMYRDEVEHKETLVSALEEDLTELRGIHNEAKAEAEARDRKKDLPPAYGNLPEEGRLPPYEVHCNDSGALEVATFKRTLRDGFMRQTMLAQKRLQDQRTKIATSPPDIVRGTAPLILDIQEAESAFFLTLSGALADAARTAEEVLQKSHDIGTTHIQFWIDENVAAARTGSHLQNIISKQKAHPAKAEQDDATEDGATGGNAGKGSRLTHLYPQVNGQELFDPVSLREHPELFSDDPDSSRLCRVIEKQAGRHAYIADRFAKLILDLVLRAIALLEVRPLNLQNKLSSHNKALAALSWSQVDVSLNEALRVAFTAETYNTAAERLLQLQAYLTQTQMLQQRLDTQGLRLPITQYFDQTWLWLSDQVESQRQEASREYDEAACARSGCALNVHEPGSASTASTGSTTEDDEDMIYRRIREGSELSSEPERDEVDERPIVCVNHHPGGRSFTQELLDRVVSLPDAPMNRAAAGADGIREAARISDADRRAVSDALGRSSSAEQRACDGYCRPAWQRASDEDQARCASLDGRRPNEAADRPRVAERSRFSPIHRRRACAPGPPAPAATFPPPPPSPTVEDVDGEEVDNVVRT